MLLLGTGLPPLLRAVNGQANGVSGYPDQLIGTEAAAESMASLPLVSGFGVMGRPAAVRAGGTDRVSWFRRRYREWGLGRPRFSPEQLRTVVAELGTARRYNLQASLDLRCFCS